MAECLFEGVPLDENGPNLIINSICSDGQLCDMCLEDITSEDGSVSITRTDSEPDPDTGFYSSSFDLSVSGGGGSQTWSTLPEKPFETIGSGLRVQGGALTATGAIADELTGFITTFGNSSQPLLSWDETDGGVDGVIKISSSGDNGTILATTVSYNNNDRNESEFNFVTGGLIYSYSDSDVGFINISNSPSPNGDKSYVVGVMNVDQDGKRFIFINGWGTHWHPDDQGGETTPVNWDTLTGKPFNMISDDFSVSGDTLSVDWTKAPSVTRFGEIVLTGSSLTEQSNHSCYTTFGGSIDVTGSFAIYPMAQLCSIKDDGGMAILGSPISINSYDVNSSAGTFKFEITYNENESMYQILSSGNFKLIWTCNIFEG